FVFISLLAPCPPLFPYTTLFRSTRRPGFPAQEAWCSAREPAATRAARWSAWRQPTPTACRPPTGLTLWAAPRRAAAAARRPGARSEEHTSELQSRENLVCRLLLE